MAEERLDRDAEITSATVEELTARLAVAEQERAAWRESAQEMDRWAEQLDLSRSWLDRQLERTRRRLRVLRGKARARAGRLRELVRAARAQAAAAEEELAALRVRLAHAEASAQEALAEAAALWERQRSIERSRGYRLLAWLHTTALPPGSWQRRVVGSGGRVVLKVVRVARGRRAA